MLVIQCVRTFSHMFDSYLGQCPNWLIEMIVFCITETTTKVLNGISETQHFNYYSDSLKKNQHFAIEISSSL